MEKLLADYEMPEGCSYAIEGENEMIQSTMSDLILMIALAIAFIYLIMVAQFQSLLSPFIVLFTFRWPSPRPFGPVDHRQGALSHCHAGLPYARGCRCE